MIDHDLVESRLRKDEGYRSIVYLDSLGFETGGIGHLILPADELSLGDAIAPDLIERWFTMDYGVAVGAASGHGWFGGLNDARQQIVVCLEFNLGARRFDGFKDTQRDIAAGQFDKAAAELLDSRWAKQVDLHGDTPGSRGGTYARILRTGLWE